MDHTKYRKYKKKYFKIKRQNNFLEEYDFNEDKPLKKEELEKILAKVILKQNNESLHRLEDQITRRFNKDIIEGQLDLNEIREIAKIINKFYNLKYDRWYA